MLYRDGDLVRVGDKKSGRRYVSYRSLVLLWQQWAIEKQSRRADLPRRN
jgi:hypothetical protein